jgi:hypothetical protein
MYQIREAALGASCLGAKVLPNSRLLRDAYGSVLDRAPFSAPKPER